MNCKEFLSLQSEYIDGCLDAETAASFRAHLMACPACRRTHTEMTALVETLHSMRDIPVPENLADRVLTSLVPEEKKPRIFALPKVLRSWQTYSVAACLILAAFLYMHSYDQYKMTTNESVSYTASPTLTPAPAEIPETAKTFNAADVSAAQTAEENRTALAHSSALNTATPDIQYTADAVPELFAEGAFPAPAATEMSPAPATEDAVPPAANSISPAAMRSAPIPAFDGETSDTVAEEAMDSAAGETLPPMGRAGGNMQMIENAETAAEEAPASVSSTAAKPTVSGASGGATGGAAILKSARPYAAVSSLQKLRLTFLVSDPAARTIFQNAKARGTASVEAAFADAGIAYTIVTDVEKDCTAEYNALADSANALSKRISGGETGLEAQLSKVETEMQTLRESCSAPALYLSFS